MIENMGTAAVGRERTLSVGARLCILLGLLLAIVAVYLLLSPVQRQGEQGAIDCGTVIEPPTDPFLKGLCGQTPILQRDRVIATGSVALVLAVGGLLVFGTATREPSPPDRFERVRSRRRRPRLTSE